MPRRRRRRRSPPDTKPCPLAQPQTCDSRTKDSAPHLHSSVPPRRSLAFRPPLHCHRVPSRPAVVIRARERLRPAAVSRSHARRDEQQQAIAATCEGASCSPGASPRRHTPRTKQRTAVTVVRMPTIASCAVLIKGEEEERGRREPWHHPHHSTRGTMHAFLYSWLYR